MSRLDPAAVAFHAIVVVVLVALCAILFFTVRSDPAPAPAKGGGLQGAVDSFKKMVEGAVQPRPAPAPAKSAVAKKPDPAPVARSTAALVEPLRPGRAWTYRVTLDPPQWRDAQLSYRTAELVSGITVYTEFSHAQGKMNFQLGMYVAKHPSHANTRFPGFFLYPVYFDKPLEIGQRFAWEWPWQLPGGAQRPGRVKRYAGEVAAWEEVALPAGKFVAARIDTTLSYVEDGRVQASAKETLWYGPKAGQLVKVVREGATPDEGARRIVAELMGY